MSRPSGRADAPRDFHWIEKNIPCQHACPARTDIPGYLAAIARGDCDEAYRINLADNVFPAILGRVCARPCEPPCRLGWPGLGEPVAICFSKRSAADVRSGRTPVVLPALFPPSGKKIAVVGSGVAGLTCARELARFGHSVAVLEKHARPGGMLRQGIPPFRLPRDVVDPEIEQITRAGVAIRCGVEVGRDVTIGQLLGDHDAVVLAGGTLRPNIPAWPGVDLRGVEHGLRFLLEVNECGRKEIGARVVVVGGGFTAMDCARAALRLGARSVGVYYRRTAEEMLVTPGEREELEHEGIPMEFLVAPKGFEGSGGRLERVRFVRTRLGEPDSGGRRRPVEIEASEFLVEADTVLLATGQFPDLSWIDPALAPSLIGSEPWLQSGVSHRTGHPRIFASGDLATGATSLIQAIGHAKGCAREIDASLMGARRLADEVSIEDGREATRTREMDAVSRQPMPALPLKRRSADAEVETGFDGRAATVEARRCYLCHYKYEIDMTRCIYCDQCVEVKPRPACIVKPARVNTDPQGRITGWEPADGRLDPDAPMFHYYINQQDCIRCNACLEVCPVKCISVQKVSLKTAPRPAGT